MNTTTIELPAVTEQLIREFIPFIRCDEDLRWAADWFITLGIGFAKHAMKNNSNLNLSDLIMMTTINNQDVIN
ncbi:MAG: hypothetical protein Q8S46_06950 [Methylotenera sp.]|nr:hypothetical protein [Methylotenera sp.]MDP2403781.1 hypothetical protein [Methylotenera sp.]MDP3095167.1 hypothetical protein [Methylotenera sp.]MDP3303876.1 hypothetical protein [Methylotenera sp.]